MSREHETQLLRGGREFAVKHAPRSFTIKVSAVDDAHHLAKDRQNEVARVTPLTHRLARVEVHEPEQRDRLIADLAGQRIPVQPEYLDVHSDRPINITDELIARFRDGVSDKDKQRLLADANVLVKGAYPHLNNTFLLRCRHTNHQTGWTDCAETAKKLSAANEVEYAEPGIVNCFHRQSLRLGRSFRSRKESREHDTSATSAGRAYEPRTADDLLPRQWHLRATSAPDISEDSDARVEAAWEITKGSRTTVIAVLDDGFDLSHPDFSGYGKIVDPIDFTGGDFSPLPEQGDFHGTACAGVVLAEDNGVGCVGVAPRCAFMPVRFPWALPDQYLIEVLRFVSTRAHVASLSWSSPPGDFPLNLGVADTLSVLSRSGGRDGRGLVVCVSAGNFNAPIKGDLSEPLSFGHKENGKVEERSVSGYVENGLAAHQDVIAVGACTSLKEKSAYSNWGQEITVAAPSDNRDPVTLEALPGRGITTTDNEPFGKGFTSGKRYTDSFGGTSSAAALIAGVCGLMKSVAPALRAHEIKQILRETAEYLPTVDARPFPGKVDAEAAVRAAARHGGENVTAANSPPWTGYESADTDKVLEILATQLSQDVSSAIDLASNVWAYEQRGQRREAVLRFSRAWIDAAATFSASTNTATVNAPPQFAGLSGAPAPGWSPNGWVPGGWVPGGWVPGGWVPGGWVPGGWVPGGPAPAEDSLAPGQSPGWIVKPGD